MKAFFLICIFALGACAPDKSNRKSSPPVVQNLKKEKTEFRELKCEVTAKFYPKKEVEKQGIQVRVDELNDNSQEKFKLVDNRYLELNRSIEILIPEDAFNYTQGLQTFWQTMKTSFLNPYDNSVRELTLVSGFNKLGRLSEISTQYAKVFNVITNEYESKLEFEKPTNGDWEEVIIRETYELDMDCQLRGGIYK